ncbi:MAG: hypothetical protein Sapg2KO_08450 [Saprospiraceae bacterium]
MQRLFLFFLLLTCFSCSTDFTLEAPWEDIPIVYGFLSLQDTAHYIRIEKAFQEPGGDARELAQIADSLYYEETLEVSLEKVISGRTFALTRVDGNQEGYARVEGPFATQPNYLYKINATDINLLAGEVIRLNINRGNNLPIVTAETQMLDDIFIRESNPPSPVNMAYDRNINFVFNVGEAAQIFDVRLLIYIHEQGNGREETKMLEWILTDDLRSVSEEGRVSVGILGEEFYRFIGSSLEQENGIQRRLEGFDVAIAAGGQEMVDLLTISEANLGLTSAQVIPRYTNLSEGAGLFSSRSKAVRKDLTITGVSQDSLRDGIYTRSLNFR